MSFTTQQRQHWMSVLAHAPTAELLRLSDATVKEFSFEIIRAPEIGLAQVRARMGNTGEQFNLGDMTLTRCVVRSSLNTVGYGYIGGRNKAHAQRAAELDALLQDPQLGEVLMERVISPMEAIESKERAKRQQQVDATRVEFFTLVRGED